MSNSSYSHYLSNSNSKSYLNSSNYSSYLSYSIDLVNPNTVGGVILFGLDALLACCESIGKYSYYTRFFRPSYQWRPKKCQSTYVCVQQVGDNIVPHNRTVQIEVNARVCVK